MDVRAEFVSYAERWMGKPYLWAGDDPMAGFDCSGLVMECGKAVGLFEDGWDFNAEGLWTRFKTKELPRPYLPYAGCLVLWLNSYGFAVHVAIMKNERLIIHAGGGGSKTATLQDAIRQNAFVMMRSLERVAAQRKTLWNQDFRVVDPFKES